MPIFTQPQLGTSKADLAAGRKHAIRVPRNDPVPDDPAPGATLEARPRTVMTPLEDDSQTETDKPTNPPVARSRNTTLAARRQKIYDLLKAKRGSETDLGELVSTNIVKSAGATQRKATRAAPKAIPKPVRQMDRDWNAETTTTVDSDGETTEDNDIEARRAQKKFSLPYLVAGKAIPETLTQPVVKMLASKGITNDTTSVPQTLTVDRCFGLYNITCDQLAGSKDASGIYLMHITPNVDEEDDLMFAAWIKLGDIRGTMRLDPSGEALNDYLRRVGEPVCPKGKKGDDEATKTSKPVGRESSPRKPNGKVPSKPTKSPVPRYVPLALRYEGGEATEIQKMPKFGHLEFLDDWGKSFACTVPIPALDKEDAVILYGTKIADMVREPHRWRPFSDREAADRKHGGGNPS